MTDWIAKLDEFLRISDREVLDHAGRVSHEQALAKAEAEFEKYWAVLINEVSPVEKHFDAAVQRLKALRNEDAKPER